MSIRSGSGVQPSGALIVALGIFSSGPVADGGAVDSASVAVGDAGSDDSDADADAEGSVPPPGSASGSSPAQPTRVSTTPVSTTAAIARGWAERDTRGLLRFR